MELLLWSTTITSNVLAELRGPKLGLNTVRSLLEAGGRRICISLGGGLESLPQEQQIKRTIGEQYPDHFPGAVPLPTGADICPNTALPVEPFGQGSRKFRPPLTSGDEFPRSYVC